MLTLSEINKLVDCSIYAGNLAIKLRNEGLKIEIKEDGSKVTNADKEIDKIFIHFIRNELKNNDIIISEEDIDSKNMLKISKSEPFWSIDPIDSTNSYIEGKSFYSLNLAYIENGIPIFGLIHAPDNKTTWYGTIEYGAFKKIGDADPKRIYAREVPEEGAVLMSSELQIVPDSFKKQLNIIKEYKIPSSIKFTYIAEGIADYYTRNRNKACDWDISSGHALILAAGGKVIFTNKAENFKYGQPPYMAPALLARGK